MLTCTPVHNYDVVMVSPIPLPEVLAKPIRIVRTRHLLLYVAKIIGSLGVAFEDTGRVKAMVLLANRPCDCENELVTGQATSCMHGDDWYCWGFAEEIVETAKTYGTE